MASPSKEENILKLILENSPLKHWHFEEIVNKSNITRASANKWLNRYTEQKILKKQKEKGKFPYFTVGNNNPVYYSLKRIYALEQLHKSNLLADLISMDTAKTIIIFGSMIKGDWYEGSDIDIFVLGNISDFDRNLYESRLGRHIEMHVFKNKQDIKRVRTGLMKNIINGYILKGDIQDIIEAIYEN